MKTNKLLTVNGLLTASLFMACIFASINVIAKTTPHANDPLSLDEINIASLLTAGPKVAARATTDSGDLSSFVSNSQEVLLIERNYDKGAPRGQRRADVYIYDYSNNELIQSLVDLNTNEVIRSDRSQGQQLPLTDNELKRAKEIIFADEDERAILQDEFKRITSRELSNTNELNIKAFTFYANSLPNRVNEASKVCGVHRCAQVIIYTDENVVFDVSQIVNLSEGVVTQRIGF